MQLNMHLLSGVVSISAGTAEKQVWRKFVDMGPGTAREEQDFVFEPFYRIDQGRKIKQGMGLGLSIAQDILHSHGGKIDLQSMPDEGCQFTLSGIDIISFGCPFFILRETKSMYNYWDINHMGLHYSGSFFNFVSIARSSFLPERR